MKTHSSTRELSPKSFAPVESFGYGDDAQPPSGQPHWHARDVQFNESGTTFRAFRSNEEWGKVETPLAGAFNVRNVLAVIAAAEAIIMENPGEPWAYKEIGLSTMYRGQTGQALDWFAKADRIGPRDPGRWTWLDGRGHALILLARDEEAIRSLISALDANRKNLSSHAFLAASYALLGRSDDARASLAAYLQGRPDSRVSTFRRLSPVPLVLTSRLYQQQHERLKAGLRKAGMPE